MPIVRARDLRTNIHEMGFEKGVVHTLELFMEEYSQHRQHMRELTELVSQCIDQVEKMVHVSSAMSETMQQIRRDAERGDEHGEQS